MTRTYFATALLCVFALGCEELEALNPFDTTTDMRCAQAPVDMSGRWQVAGQGERSGCADDRLNADSFEVLPLTWTFAQTQDPVDANAAQLELGGGAGAEIQGFFSQGEVRGQCVTFTTEESAVSYDWAARVVSEGVVRGDFRVTGPGSCSGEGSFEMRRTQ